MVGSVFRLNQALGAMMLSARGEISRVAGSAVAGVLCPSAAVGPYSTYPVASSARSFSRQHTTAE